MGVSDVDGNCGYVHTITFSHRFLLFGSKLELPWDCGTIENDAKTLPCARSLCSGRGKQEEGLVQEEKDVPTWRKKGACLEAGKEDLGMG